MIRLLLPCILLLLAGCRADIADLEDWRDGIDRQTAGPNTDGLPPLMPPEPILLPENTAVPDLFAQTAPRPCTDCTAAEVPPLQRLPLSRLAYIGHIRRAGRITAYLQTDDAVLPAAPGQTVGSEGGRLIRILPQALHIETAGKVRILPLRRDDDGSGRPSGLRQPRHTEPPTGSAASAVQE
ncbi:hypothetical protein V6667_02180 [Neisseria leonii]|uniref:Pilus assembly protein PilP n=1 Tax=Neisseria leonii TaxID=2995413 RepID=A0A9X4E259_9NEIS|nr:hypothetical protein [Neisseria sp. 51.81]MDD9327334.1 hypothetical protein [Neisseria sp. 51.81]